MIMSMAAILVSGDREIREHWNLVAAPEMKKRKTDTRGIFEN